jgi:hypothetical protein
MTTRRQATKPGGDKPYSNSSEAYQKELAALDAKLTSNPGAVTDADIARVERLKKVVDLGSAERAPSTARTTAIMVAGVCVLAIATALAFVIPRDTVAIHLTATELTLVLDSAWTVTREMGVDRLTVGGIRGIAAPDVGGRPEAFLALSVLDLHADSGSRITLSALAAASGTTITISKEPARARLLTLHFDDRAMRLAATLSGAFPVQTDSGGVWLRYPKATRIEPDREGAAADVSIEVPEQNETFFVVPLGLADLRPFHADLDRRVSGEGNARDTVSTLRSASLSFSSIGGEELKVHPTEVLRLEGLKRGRLRALGLTKDAIEADFTGSVSRVTLDGRSVMPSLFDVLRKQHTLAAIWGALGTLFGVTWGVVRFWKKPS